MVIITGYPKTDLMPEGLQVGPFAVIKKPFTLTGNSWYLDVWQADLGMP